jgi:hypothetical protein
MRINNIGPGLQSNVDHRCPSERIHPGGHRPLVQ